MQNIKSNELNCSFRSISVYSYCYTQSLHESDTCMNMNFDALFFFPFFNFEILLHSEACVGHGIQNAALACNINSKLCVMLYI